MDVIPVPFGCVYQFRHLPKPWGIGCSLPLRANSCADLGSRYPDLRDYPIQPKLELSGGSIHAGDSFLPGDRLGFPTIPLVIVFAETVPVFIVGTNES